jgi:SPP1 family predicted phage head-tail adaptor
MKYNKNEVTGKMRDRIILQNVNRSRSLTGFASESWADTATIWAFAESKLPGSNETIIDGKNTAKNVCDFTIRYISTITEESRVVWGDKLYQVKNLKVSHDRRFISFQGVFYDSYILTGVNVDASVNGIGTTLANLKLIMSVIGQANASASTTATITKIIEVSSLVNANASLSGDINFVQKAQASLLATGTTTADLTVQAAGLLLDLYPNAAAAYSLRKLRTAYSGSAVRVRRSSDNTEQDIGFVADELDTASLLAFCGAGNGFVQTWYDQSGNARDAAQTTQTKQPRIVSSGVIESTGFKNSINFNNITSALIKLFTTSFSLQQPYTIFSIVKGVNTGGQRFISDGLLLNSGQFALQNEFELGIYAGGGVYFNSVKSLKNIFLGYALFNTSNSIVSIDNLTGTTGNTGTANMNGICIGANGRGDSSINGYLSEYIIYNTNQNSNRTNISNNINGHYAIY